MGIARVVLFSVVQCVIIQYLKLQSFRLFLDLACVQWC